MSPIFYGLEISVAQRHEVKLLTLGGGGVGMVAMNDCGRAATDAPISPLPQVSVSYHRTRK